METSYHRPVLLKASVDGLDVKADGVYVDVTFGGGGHSREILSRLGDKGKLFAFDQDEDARSNVPDDPRFTLIGQNFRYIRQFLKFYGILSVDGILADFGVSSHQFDRAERGFSTRFEGRLDMRMNRQAQVSAYEVVNSYEYDRLRTLIFKYGELRMADRIAECIINARKSKPIRTTLELNEVVRPLFPRTSENKMLAQLYQALRIEVNEELAALEEFLMQTPGLIRVGGRLSLISYHSLEDRLVKRFIQTGNLEGKEEKDFYGNKLVPFKKVSKMITPTPSEIAENSRARSARLRIAERIEIVEKKQV